MASISKAAFARLVGVSRAAITKLCHAGRIPVLPNGKLDKNQALAAYQQTQQVGREISADNGGKSKGGLNLAVAAMSDDSTAMAAGSLATIITQYNKAKTVEKTFQAKLKQLEYEKEKELLVPTLEVEADAADLAEELRGRLFAIAPRAAVKCEGKPARAIERIIEDEISYAIEAFRSSRFINEQD